MKIWINGKFIDEKKARISVFDRGFLYGDGVFETMRSYAGVVFKLDEHLNRLFGAMKTIRIAPPYSAKYLKEVVNKSLVINGLKSAYIRLTVTRGEGRFGINYPAGSEIKGGIPPRVRQMAERPNVVVVAKGFGEYPGWMYKKGITCRVVKARQNEHSPVSNIKSLNFLNHILARLDAKRAGADEAILANTGGFIAEAATSNIFLVKGASLITPSLESGIVPGITRDVIVLLARALRLDFRQKAVSCRELFSADEIFLTNSLVEVLPVTGIDGKKIGSGSPGEITKLLRISYQKQVIREVLR